MSKSKDSTTDSNETKETKPKGLFSDAMAKIKSGLAGLSDVRLFSDVPVADSGIQEHFNSVTSALSEIGTFMIQKGHALGIKVMIDLPSMEDEATTAPRSTRAPRQVRTPKAKGKGEGSPRFATGAFIVNLLEKSKNAMRPSEIAAALSEATDGESKVAVVNTTLSRLVAKKAVKKVAAGQYKAA